MRDGENGKHLKIAVFIDFDNIEIGVKSTLQREFDVALVLEALKERGEIVTKIATPTGARWRTLRASCRSTRCRWCSAILRRAGIKTEPISSGARCAGDGVHARPHQRLRHHQRRQRFHRSGQQAEAVRQDRLRGGREGLHQHHSARTVTSSSATNPCWTMAGPRAASIANTATSGSPASSAPRKNNRLFRLARPRPRSGFQWRPSPAAANASGWRTASAPRVAAVAAAASSGARSPSGHAAGGAALQVLERREVRPQLGLLKSTMLQLDSSFSERAYGAGSFTDFIDRLRKADLILVTVAKAAT